jgi:hypothetical protein
MLSEMVQTVNISPLRFAFHLTRFPFRAQMATRLGKSRVRVRGVVENLTTGTQKLLTSRIIPPTMQTLTSTYVFVDKK